MGKMIFRNKKGNVRFVVDTNGKMYEVDHKGQAKEIKSEKPKPKDIK